MARTRDNDVQDEAYRLDPRLLSDLWVFRATARAGSMTGAARRLSVTQGAVSQRIGRLEGRLGTALFVRRGGAFVLTEAGFALLDTMNEVAVKLHGTLSRFDRVQRLSLVISCLPSLATEWLVPNLVSFYAKHPDIELLIRAQLLTPTAEQMEDEGLDVIIGYQRDPSDHLQELGVLQEQIVPVCSREYREMMAQASNPPPITRLHDEMPWVGGPRDFEWEAWANGSPQWADRTTGERFFNLAHLTYHAAVCGQGVAIGRAVLINRLLNRGELIAATNLPPVQGASYRIMAHRPGPVGSPVRRFAAWLVSEMEKSQQQTLAMIAQSKATACQ